MDDKTEKKMESSETEWSVLRGIDCDVVMIEGVVDVSEAGREFEVE